MTGGPIMHMPPMAAAVVFVSFFETTAIAADPTAIREKEQAARIGQLKSMLTDEDPSVRVAAFQSMALFPKRTASGKRCQSLLP
jgi:hypothetical protein